MKYLGVCQWDHHGRRVLATLAHARVRKVTWIVCTKTVRL